MTGPAAREAAAGRALAGARGRVERTASARTEHGGPEYRCRLTRTLLFRALLETAAPGQRTEQRGRAGSRPGPGGTGARDE